MHTAILVPSRGRSVVNRSRTLRSTGMERSAQSTRRTPALARPRSATSFEGGVIVVGPPLVAVVAGLVGAADAHADVGGPFLAGLGELDAEGGQAQARHLLAEGL